MKATFIDFEDSFSFNIVQELTLVGFEVTVINWNDYDENPLDGLLVAGPGPGHPDDYVSIFHLFKRWLSEDRPLFGVCLGHQIFWRLQGGEVVRSKEPLHGQRVLLNLTEEWKQWLGINEKVYVQRYNSLSVPGKFSEKNPYCINFIQDNEILMTRTNRVITYQFHPESIGTTFRTEFMKVICSIMA